MTRCKHQLAPLVPEPPSGDARLVWIFCPYTDYHRCTLCGRVGRPKGRRGNWLWLQPEDAAYVEGKAAIWNADITERFPA